MKLVLDLQEGTKQSVSILPAANCSRNSTCPICYSGVVNGILIEPLCFDDVDRAVSLKRDELPSSGTMQHHLQKQNSRKHAREEEDHEIDAESPYLLLSNSNSCSISCSGLSRGQQRTGRWTNEESALVDFLVTAFDQGLLPLPHGIKLNEFLGDMLLCKSSRLTKKMKNAKLSTRSFALGKSCLQFTISDREQLSKLQDDFLSSLPSESIRLVLKMNLTKQWRTHFYNICLQVGYSYLHEKEWTTSLQEMESRAKKAEEVIRRLRRRKMGLSQQIDRGSFVNPNSMVEDIKTDFATSASTATTPTNTTHSSIVSNDQKSLTAPSSEEEGPNLKDDEERAFFSTLNSITKRPRTLSTDFSVSSVGNQGRLRSFSEDFDALLDVLTEETPTEGPDAYKGNTSSSDEKSSSKFDFTKPLLEAVVTYMETKNISFHHSDLWVPSFSPSGENNVGQSKSVDVDQLMLYHAGYASRRDINNTSVNMLHEFGEYSSYFSFEPGKGLPGRVYASGVASWEHDVNDMDPKLFGRVEGAELYGVKTALAIPLNMALVGRIVVILYSCENIPEDSSLTQDLAAEFAKYSPEPKWKVTIDSNAASAVSKTDELSMKLIMPSLKQDDPSCFSQHSPYQGLQSTNYSQLASNMGHNTTRTMCSEVNDDREDHQLANFLDKNMPPASSSLSDGQISSLTDSNTLRPYFLSFRLLLLRPSIERTSRENEIIGILQQSSRAYVSENRRDAKELAMLIVKDWVCLKSTYSLQKVDTQQKEPYRSEGSIISMAAMPPPQTITSTAVELYQHAHPSIQQRERQLSMERCQTPSSGSSIHSQGDNDLSSIQPYNSTVQLFVSDSSEKPSGPSISPSPTLSKMTIDHKRYLPRTTSLDSTQYTNTSGAATDNLNAKSTF
jgi:hypothetical protein